MDKSERNKQIFLDYLQLQDDIINGIEEKPKIELGCRVFIGPGLWGKRCNKPLYKSSQYCKEHYDESRVSWHI
jgi:hypothetical protein